MNSLFLYAVVVLVWGSTWLAIAFQVESVDPSVAVFHRYAGAAVLAAAWCRLRGWPLGFGWRAHWRFVALGTCLFSVNFVLMYAAERNIGSALAAVVFATLLWMNMALSRIVLGTRIGWRAIAGSAIGMSGLLLIFLPQLGDFSFGDDVAVGALLALGGTLVASIGNIVSQSAQADRLPLFPSMTWGMFYGAIICFALALAEGAPLGVAFDPAYLLSLGYLVVFGSLVGFGAYLTLVGRIGAHRAGYAAVLFPVMALVLSIVFEGFEPTVSDLAGIVLVAVGNLLALGGGAAGIRESVATLIRILAGSRQSPSAPPWRARNRQPSAVRTRTSV